MTVTKVPMDQGAEARFWSRVEKSSACWLWTGTRQVGGYGRFTIGRKSLLTHRVAYETYVGPIPEGLELDHLCRTPNCVRITHLQPVTRAENVRRSRLFTEGILAKAAAAARVARTHCRRGHEFTARNTRRDGSTRICRSCRREDQAGYVARKAVTA